MNRYPLLLIITLLEFFGCNRLRIKDFPAQGYSALNQSYHTASVNYQRNTICDSEIEPPLVQEWDETLIALPSGGFTATGDWLFFGTVNGYLGAVNLSDGDMKGKRNLGDACPAPPTIWDHYLYQPYEDGKYGLIAYDILNGDKLWLIDELLSSSSPVIMKNRIYHQTVNGMVFCLRQETGQMLWQKYLQQNVRNSLAYSEGILIHASMSGNITALDQYTGGTIWTLELKDPVFADPVISGDVVYIANFSGYLYAIDLTSGKILHTRKFNVPLYHGPAIDGNQIFLGLSDGRMAKIDASTFAILYVFEGEGPVSGSPLVTRSYIYFTTLSKYLYVLSRSNLTLLQEIEFDARLRSTPIIKDGKLVIACENDRVIALARAE